MDAETRQALDEIRERNQRVEADKAWETSWARRLLLAAVTYALVLYFLLLVQAPNPYLNALIPAGAFLVQQLTLPWLKRAWLERTRKP